MNAAWMTGPENQAQCAMRRMQCLQVRVGLGNSQRSNGLQTTKKLTARFDEERMELNTLMYRRSLYRETDGDNTDADPLEMDQRILHLEEHNRSLQHLVCDLLAKNESLRSLLS